MYARWGEAIGLQVAAGSKFVLGGDNRNSTPQFMRGMIEGLCRAGLDVVDVGELPTPMIRYARRRLMAAGCAAVTGENLPPGWNGLKWTLGDLPPTHEETQRIRKCPTAAPPAPARQTGEPRTLDVTFDYVAWMQEAFVEAMESQLHVVIDPMHGSYAQRARRYLQAIFPRAIFSTIRDTPDGCFCNCVPSCMSAENLQELSETVYRERADLGVALDGDGQCAAFVDEEGMPLIGEEVAWLLLSSMERKLADQRFVCDLRLSNCIPATARKFGGVPLIERNGYSAIRTRMAKSDALFGADLDGRYFFQALGGEADALYAACSLIAFVAKSHASLGSLRRRCGAVYLTPELHLPLPRSKQEWVIEGIRLAWEEGDHSTLDGLRVDLGDGWFLVRPQPEAGMLTFRAESSDWPSLDALVSRLCQAAPAVGEELWAAYRTAMGTDELMA